MEPVLTSEVEKILEALHNGLLHSRKDAARKLGDLTTSSEKIVMALLMAKENDSSYEVRELATASLQASAHQAIIQQNPDLFSKIATLQTQQENQRKRQTITKALRRLTVIGTVVTIVIGLWTLVAFSRPEIESSVGTLVITKVRLGDRAPIGCISSGPGCSVARPGYRILIIRMIPKNRDDIEALFNAIPKEVSVVADNGSQTRLVSVEMNVSPPSVSLAFAVRDSEHNFKLIWPGNPNIDINSILYFLP